VLYAPDGILRVRYPRYTHRKIPRFKNLPAAVIVNILPLAHICPYAPFFVAIHTNMPSAAQSVLKGQFLAVFRQAMVRVCSIAHVVVDVAMVGFVIFYDNAALQKKRRYKKYVFHNFTY